MLREWAAALPRAPALGFLGRPAVGFCGAWHWVFCGAGIGVFWVAGRHRDLAKLVRTLSALVVSSGSRNMASSGLRCGAVPS